MSNWHHLVVAFDVSDDKRRRHVTQFLSGWGTRVQFSVFECRVKESRIEAFLAHLKEHLNPEVDRLGIYLLCHQCLSKRLSYGNPLGILEEDGWFV